MSNDMMRAIAIGSIAPLDRRRLPAPFGAWLGVGWWNPSDGPRAQADWGMLLSVFGWPDNASSKVFTAAELGLPQIDQQIEILAIHEGQDGTMDTLLELHEQLENYGCLCEDWGEQVDRWLAARWSTLSWPDRAKHLKFAELPQRLAMVEWHAVHEYDEAGRLYESLAEDW
jgi:hypothetical protein